MHATLDGLLYTSKFYKIVEVFLQFLTKARMFKQRLSVRHNHFFAYLNHNGLNFLRAYFIFRIQELHYEDSRELRQFCVLNFDRDTI